MTFYFFYDVLLLHFPLKATQGVFERLAFLQSDFCQRNYTPKPVRLDSSVIARRARKVKHYIEFASRIFPFRERLQKLTRSDNCTWRGAYALVALAKLVGTW